MLESNNMSPKSSLSHATFIVKLH